MFGLHFGLPVLGLFALLALGEYWAVRHRGGSYDARAALASIGVAVGQFLLKPLNLLVIGTTYAAAATLAPQQWPSDHIATWVAGFIAVEFVYYWFHRWSHRNNWLWATHAVHHSAAEMRLPAAIRLGWTGLLSGGWLVYVPLIIAGFPPAMIGALLAINLGYQYFLHTELIGRLGPLEWVMNTPSHHRAHHASNAAQLDCNFGGMTIVFDRLFGTFVPEPVVGGLRYGLTHPIDSHRPAVIAFTQWHRLFSAVRAASGWRARARLLVGPPMLLDPATKEG